MYDSFDLAVRIDDDERGYFLFLHESKCRGCQGAAADGEGMCVHNLARGMFQGVRAIAFEETTKITV